MINAFAMQLARRVPKAASAACLATSLALLVAPLRGHIDDTDAQLYQVLSRQMASARAWLEPGLPPGSVRPFREHLPFGLWPSVAVVRAFGERALPLPSILFSLGTVALVLLLGARLASPRAGVAAALLLGCTETFFLYGARPRLDPLLVLLATLAAAPALLGRLREPRGFALAAAAGALAALVKGPFGLVPLAAAGAARAALDAWGTAKTGVSAGTEAPAGPAGAPNGNPAREAGARGLASGLALAGAALALAALPAALFLAADRAQGGSWWGGYVQDQLVSSARGLRRDGLAAPLFPFDSIKARFWPGLPLLALGALQALAVPLPAALRPSPARRPALRLLALASAIALAVLCLPVRKVWNHELVVYPLLAVLAGTAAEPLLRRIPGRAALRALAVLCLAAWALSLAGLGALLLLPPCVGSREFAAPLAALGRGAKVLVVSPNPDWRMIATLAAEHDLSPWPQTALPGGAAAEGSPSRAVADQARLALSSEEAGPAPPPPWRIEGRARGWLLLSR